MNKDFIPYEQALALKNLGFDADDYFGFWNLIEYDTEWTFDIRINMDSVDYIEAPTFSQAFRWFREKYKLRSTIIPYWIGDTYMTIIEGKMIDEIEPKQFQTYEEAELACLIELIEITKQNG